MVKLCQNTIGLTLPVQHSFPGFEVSLGILIIFENPKVVCDDLIPIDVLLLDPVARVLFLLGLDLLLALVEFFLAAVLQR